MLLYLITSRSLFEKALRSGYLKQIEPFNLYNKKRILQILEENINPRNYESFVMLVISTKKLHTSLKKVEDTYYVSRKIPVEFFEDIVEFEFWDGNLYLLTSSGKEVKAESFFNPINE